MQHRYASLFRAAVFLLSLTVFAACRQDDPAKPATEQVAKLTFLTEMLDNENATEADRKKAGELLNGLSFGEMESLIDLRHRYYLKTGVVDAERAAYLLDLRHTMNRKAFELKGKPFHQLDWNNSEEVIATVKGGKGSPKANTGTNPNARTAGDCVLSSNPPCTAWRDNGAININAFASGDKEIKGFYSGMHTYQCSDGKYQKDCDYVFVYEFSKIYKHQAWKPIAGINVITGGAAAKLIDKNPNRIDCGTYRLEILYGKGRIDFAFGTPLRALEYLKLVLERDIECGWCYTGTGATRKWYSSGIYFNLDGWSGLTDAWGVEQPCTCTVDNYPVY